MDRRQFLLSLSALAMLPWVKGCSRSLQPLNIGIHPWIGYEPLRIAEELKWLPPELQLIQYQSAQTGIEKLKAGTLDAACLTLDEMLRARADGTALTAVTVFDISAGADMVIARNNIENLSDLKGQRIGVEHSAVGALMLFKLLDAAQLSQDDITIINAPLDEQIQIWQRHEVDAMISFEPNSSKMQQQGGHNIFDSRQTPDTIFDVLAVRTDLLNSHAESIRLLVMHYFQALNHRYMQYEDTLYRIASYQNISVEEVEEAFSGIIQPKIEANRVYLSDTNGRLSQAASTIMNILIQNELLSQPDDLTQLMTAEFLPSEQAL